MSAKVKYRLIMLATVFGTLACFVIPVLISVAYENHQAAIKASQPVEPERDFPVLSEKTMIITLTDDARFESYYNAMLKAFDDRIKYNEGMSEWYAERKDEYKSAEYMRAANDLADEYFANMEALERLRAYCWAVQAMDEQYVIEHSQEALNDMNLIGSRNYKYGFGQSY